MRLQIKYIVKPWLLAYCVHGIDRSEVKFGPCTLAREAMNKMADGERCGSVLLSLKKQDGDHGWCIIDCDENLMCYCEVRIWNVRSFFLSRMNNGHS